jgi:hypothetical protein
METLRFFIWILTLSLMLGGASLWVPENATAEGLRVEKRIKSRQDRRGDRRENFGDGVEDRQDFREGRRESIGEGPESRIENRQDKRGDRRDRAVDRMEDRGDRLDKRF